MVLVDERECLVVEIGQNQEREFSELLVEKLNLLLPSSLPKVVLCDGPVQEILGVVNQQFHVFTPEVFAELIDRVRHEERRRPEYSEGLEHV